MIVTEFLDYRLIKATKRLVFDIIKQDPRTIYTEKDDIGFKFVASNGYEVISRSRMDIQTERLWLLGGSQDQASNRSGTMVFSSNTKRDKADVEFVKAIEEWNKYWSIGLKNFS